MKAMVATNKKDRDYMAAHKVSYAGNQYKVVSYSRYYTAWIEGASRNLWDANAIIRETREDAEAAWQAWLADANHTIESAPDHIPARDLQRLV